MTQIKIKYVQAWVDGEGRSHHYFRRLGFPRARLPGLPGSAEFMAAYQAALAVPTHPIGAARTKPGSLNAALVLYLQSPEFKELSPGTQTMRRAILERWRGKDGDKPIAMLPKEYILRLLSPLQRHAARSWLKSIRHFVSFCIEHKMIATDPTLGVKVKVPKSDGHHTWNNDQIAEYEALHPVGSKARLALALGLYTAQRRGDVIRMGRQHIRDVGIVVRQEKTAEPLIIPIHPELQAVLDATPTTGQLTLLTGKRGMPYAANDFSEQFRAWCDAAGLPKECVFHGLRKASLTRLADVGCTVHQIAAVSGHRTLKEIERYTKAADQVRLAREAMQRVGQNKTGQETVKPEPQELSKPLNNLQKKSVG
jgi:integrase